jgi:UDP-N-acetylmuramoylalanine--D-glutamate ligase
MRLHQPLYSSKHFLPTSFSKIELRKPFVRIAEEDISRCTVLGFGSTGRAVTEFLLSHGVHPFVSDCSTLPDGDRAFLESHGISYEEGRHTQAAFLSSELVILSPGVSPELPLLKGVREQGIRVLSELDLAYQISPKTSIIAVTGTKGKGTTVKLIEILLRQNGLAPIVAGNIGIPVISIVDQIRTDRPLILEVSSFQLEQSVYFRPNIAVLLNLTPDHLDRHKTMEAYRAAKARLFQNQTGADTAILPSHLAASFRPLRCRCVLFDQLKLPQSLEEKLTPHNRVNLQAAIAACKALISDCNFSRVKLNDLQEAFSLPFCLHYEGVINSVKVINDSKSTNAASTLAAIHSFNEPIVLVLGGRHKQAGYEQLAQAITAHSIRQTVLYGEAATFLEAILRRAGYLRITSCRDLEEAVTIAIAAAHPGDVLLFSPACSSYDQYHNYLQRGEAFSRFIRSYPSFSTE